MNKKSLKLNSLLGVLIVLAIVIFGNVTSSKISLRKDITENKLYTLNEGTKNILAQVDTPITLNFYFSKSLDNIPSQLKNYSKQVMELLEEYYEHSDYISLNIIDPEPDSEKEENAQNDGVIGQPIGHGVNFYFGLTVSGVKEEDEVIAFFDQRREEFLEYDITRAIYLLSREDKMKIGIISSEEVLGMKAPPPQMGMPPNMQKDIPAWHFTSELSKLYDLQRIEKDAESIDKDIDLLLILHPKELSEKTQYAVDQFLMLGKNIIVYADPFFSKDQAQGQFRPPSTDKSLEKLFAGWGVKMDSSKILMDIAMAYPGQQTKIPNVLMVREDNLSKESPISAPLNNLLMINAGSLSLIESKGVQFTPLISSTKNALEEDKMKVMYSQPAQLLGKFKDKGKVFHTAGIYKGIFKSAFAQAPAGLSVTHTSESGSVANLMVVADFDMLIDQYCMRPIQIGQMILGYQPLNQNVAFLNNAVEVLLGSNDLISLRSRGKFLRPFDRVIEIEVEANKEFQGQLEKLEKKKADLEKAITNLAQKQGGQGQQLMITPEMEMKLKEFTAEKTRANKEIRKLRKNLRKDVERLGLWLKFFNIAFVPLLIALLGLTLSIIRSRKVRS